VGLPLRETNHFKTRTQDDIYVGTSVTTSRPSGHNTPPGGDIVREAVTKRPVNVKLLQNLTKKAEGFLQSGDIVGCCRCLKSIEYSIPDISENVTTPDSRLDTILNERSEKPWFACLYTFWNTAHEKFFGFPETTMTRTDTAYIWSVVSAIILNIAKQTPYLPADVSMSALNHLLFLKVTTREQPETKNVTFQPHVLEYLNRSLVTSVAGELPPTCFSGLPEFESALRRDLTRTNWSDMDVKSTLLYGMSGCGKKQLSGCIQHILRDTENKFRPMYKLHCGEMSQLAGDPFSAAAFLTQIWTFLHHQNVIILMEEIGVLSEPAVRKLRSILLDYGSPIVIMTCSDPKSWEELGDVRKLIVPCVHHLQFVDVPRAEVRSNIIEQSIIHALQLNGTDTNTVTRLTQLRNADKYKKLLKLVVDSTGANFKQLNQLLRGLEVHLSCS
jgi:hypothetical protein